MAIFFKWWLHSVVLFGLHHQCDGSISPLQIVRRAFEKGFHARDVLYDDIKHRYREYDESGPVHSCRWQHGNIVEQSALTLYKEKYAVLYLAATTKLAEATSMSPAQLQSHPHFREAWRHLNAENDIAEEGGCEGDSDTLKQYCKRIAHARFRTADGLCNNVYNPTWGRSHTPHVRLLTPQFGDEFNIGDTPRINGVGGTQLPSARQISVDAFANSTSIKDPRHTHMLMAMGQFLDHDLTLTPVSKGADGTDIDCCAIAKSGNFVERPECFRIEIPDDPFFTVPCMNFVRSSPSIQQGCGLSHRETLNQLTHFVDASNVYGSTESETQALRAGGFLKTRGNGLPPAAPADECILTDFPELRCLQTGDERSNEILNLGMMHIVFLREHNRLARKLQKKCRRFQSHSIRLFEETRRIVIGIMQQIVFYEYLPKILGPTEMRKHRLEADQYTGYNPHVDPSIFTEFSTAAFRFGHSMVMDEFIFFNKDFSKDFEKPVFETFFKPIEIQSMDTMTKLIRFLATNQTNAVDRAFVPSILDKLFLDELGLSFDLTALNIQRGRDHGLPTYMAIRQVCGLTTVSTFAALPDHSEDDRTRLANTYNDVADVDLFVGGIMEIPVDGGVVGPTFACIIGKQFKKLKFGDSFYFERRRSFRSYREFTPTQIAALRRHTMAKVLCENSGIRYIQRDVFRVPECITNPTLDCRMIPDLNIRLFC